MWSALGINSPKHNRHLGTFLAFVVLVAAWNANSADVNNKLVSRAAGEKGAIGNGTSGGPDMTPDGKFIVFESSSSNLVPNGSAVRQVYFRDLKTGTVELISVNAAGGPGNDVSYQAHVSSDGRYVSFTSAASNLVAGDTNGFDDIFVRDRFTGTTVRVSLAPGGVQANDVSFQSRITGDGRFVLFESRATNLVTGDTNTMADGFLWDRTTGLVERVTLSNTGAQLTGSANGRNETTSISDDGRYIAFQTDLDVTNAVAGDTNNAQDVFIRDRTLNTTTRISVNGSGVQGNGHSTFPFISRDGNTLVFSSFASNLASGDTNNTSDIFVWRRATGALTRITNGNGTCQQTTVSSNGRFVAFASQASNLVPGDSNNFGDQFLHDTLTSTTVLLSQPSDGTPGNDHSGSHELPGQQLVFCCYAYVSDDGRFIAYDSDASNLVFDDTNGRSDVFVHDRSPATIARAGGDQTVFEGQAVRLDGSTSVGPAITFQWEQTGGPAVLTPTGANEPRFLFTAPQVTGNTLITFRLVVTGNDGVSSFDTVRVTVVDSDKPFIDSDGDGIPDDLEIVAGTDPFDPNSKPLPLTVKKFQMKANFAKTNADTCKVDGIVEMPEKFTPANLEVRAKIAGVQRELVLDGKGRAPRGSTGLRLKYKKPKKKAEFAGGPVTLSLSYKAASFMAGLTIANEDQKAGTTSVPVLLVINGKAYAASIDSSVKSRKDKTAALKKLGR